MAPIKKSRRRALMELDEIKWWFSDVLSDPSYMFRYDNIDYPDSDWDDLPPDFWDTYIDDEFLHGHSTYQTAALRKLFNPPIDQDNKALFANPRFIYFTKAMPVLFLLTTSAFLLPSGIKVASYLASTAKSWITSFFSKTDDTSSYSTIGAETQDDEELLQQYADEYTALHVPLPPPTLNNSNDVNHPQQQALRSYRRLFSNRSQEQEDVSQKPSTAASIPPSDTTGTVYTIVDESSNDASDDGDAHDTVNDHDDAENHTEHHQNNSNDTTYSADDSSQLHENDTPTNTVAFDQESNSVPTEDAHQTEIQDNLVDVIDEDSNDNDQ